MTKCCDGTVVSLMALVGLLLGVVVQHPYTTWGTENDGVAVFRQVERSEIFTSGAAYRYPFGFRLALHEVNRFTGDTFLSGRLLVGASAVGTICLVYLLFRRLLNPPLGLVTATLTGLHPQFLESATFVNTEAPWQLLQTAALATFVAALINGRPRWYGLAGLLLGLAYLIRYPSIIALPLMVAAAILVEGRRVRDRRALLNAALLVSTFALVAAPQILMNYQDYGSFQPTQADALAIALYERGGGDFRALVPENPAALRLPSNADPILGVILDDPQLFVHHYVSNLSDLPLARMVLRPFVGFETFISLRGLVTGLLLLFLGLGLHVRLSGKRRVDIRELAVLWGNIVNAWRNSARAAWTFLATYVVVYVLALSVFFVEDRYFVVILPIGIAIILSMVKASVGDPRLLAVFCILCCLLAIPRAYAWAESVAERHEPVYEVGQELERIGVSPADLILSPYPVHYDYNLNRQDKRFRFVRAVPALNVSELQAEISRVRPRFLLWNTMQLGYYDLSRRETPPFLRAIYVNPAKSVGLYEVEYDTLAGLVSGRRNREVGRDVFEEPGR